MKKKNDLRILNHWACSGGSLISKCINALSNIVFLNEIHPYAYLRHAATSEDRYLPTDLIQQLSFQRNKRDNIFCISAFVGAINNLNNKVIESNKILVLRNHSHIDFFSGSIPRRTSLLSDILNEDNNLIQILSVRHPLDSWLSMMKTGWNKHIPFNDFSEYCIRAQIMVNAFKNTPIIHYESFCINPQQSMVEICKIFKLKYSIKFLENFSTFKLSGDSGRTGNVIKPRERRNIPNNLLNKIDSSNEYIDLCYLLNYNPDYKALHPYISST